MVAKLRALERANRELRQANEILRRPALILHRRKRDMALKPEIERVFAYTFEVFGARKIWRPLSRGEHCGGALRPFES